MQAGDAGPDELRDRPHAGQRVAVAVVGVGDDRDVDRGSHLDAARATSIMVKRPMSGQPLSMARE